MDGTDDWLPDMAYARLPARTVGQLTNMLWKIMYYEANVTPQDDFVSRAGFVTSEENYTLTEGTQNHVIARHLDPRAYVSDKLYRHTCGATSDQVIAAANSGNSLFVYSGHGLGKR